jgi:hypothetical protein
MAELFTFNVPESIHTYPNGINASREVSGFFVDGNGDYHGFIRTVGAEQV